MPPLNSALTTAAGIAMIVVGASACAPPRAPLDSGEPPSEGNATVRINNVTVQTERIWLVFGGASHLLGTVGALESRNFKVMRKTLVGYESFQLVISARDGGGRRVSESFPLSGARMVTWTIDATQRQSVVLQ